MCVCVRVVGRSVGQSSPELVVHNVAAVECVCAMHAMALSDEEEEADAWNFDSVLCLTKHLHRNRTQQLAQISV